MKVKVKYYENGKYTQEKCDYTLVLNNVKDVSVCKSVPDDGIKDEFGEYCVIRFINGDTSTWRNSHVDVFRI